MFRENRTIGILGGGQLGKMILDVCNRWDLKVFVLDPDINCASSKLCSKFFKGNLMDFDTVVEFGKNVDLFFWSMCSRSCRWWKSSSCHNKSF